MGGRGRSTRLRMTDTRTPSTIGEYVPMVDGPEKVTGAAKFTADFLSPDTLSGRILRRRVGQLFCQFGALLGGLLESFDGLRRQLLDTFGNFFRDFLDFARFLLRFRGRLGR